MAIRIVMFAALAAVAAVMLTTGSPPAPAQAQVAAPVSGRAATQLPPPLFSPAYVETLRDIAALEESDALRLEQRLAAAPGDLQSRLKLMAYHRRPDRAGRHEDQAKRVRHVLWLIEHHPESELLHSPVSLFSPGELSAADYNRAVALWNAAGSAKRQDAAVQWNAATFFEPLDPELHLTYLEATARADPNHPHALRPLAHLYALAILESGPLAARARAGLEASNNVWVLGNAAYMLQSQYNHSLQAGRPNAGAAELADRYFRRAKAIDPGLDRQKILPQIDVAAIARSREQEEQSRREWEARAEKAIARMRRLPVNAFADLPATVRSVLASRHCSVPQPSVDGPARNVIRGEFFARGQQGWAVLCSANYSTSLLVFRSDHDASPDVIDTVEDRIYLQLLDGDAAIYSREIRTVDRDFIMGHFRSHGGPEPPPVDHHGIDDAFLEKASTTRYFHHGHWLQLPGAD
jgi:hypothetical protein